MHFFIDHLQLGLVAQQDADKFGPLTSNASSIYNVTSRFDLVNEAKAFACLEGMLVVQQSSIDSTLVNFILKPLKGSVKYFVYKGILKSSLINGSNIVSQASTNNELIARIWSTAQSGTTSYATGTLGFSNSIPDTDNIETIFNFSIANVKPVYVKESEWIGTFTKDFKAGFEIIRETKNVTVNLQYARGEKYQVNASGLTGFNEIVKRDEILSFIDPAAFFGLYYNEGVKISTYSNSTKSTVSVKAGPLYSSLLIPFVTKNCVYVDIRSEKGYSYNFYQNYGNSSGNNIKIGAGVTPVEQAYNYNSWPILVINATQNTTGVNNNIRIKLRIDDNTEPTIYIERRDFKDTNPTSHYFNIKEIIVNSTTLDWSKELKFVFPNTGPSGAKLNVSSYIKIYYFKGLQNPNTINSVLNSNKYFDSAFGPIDFNLNSTTKFSENSSLNFIFEKLNPINGTGNFGFAAKSGAFWDNERVILYSQLVSKNNENNSGKEFLNTYSRKLLLNNQIFKSSSIGSNLDIICRKYQKNLGQYQEVKILGVNYFKIDSLKEKENALFLGLTITEIQTVQNAAGFSNKHQRYVFLESTSTDPLVDNNGQRFYEYIVKVQGLDTNGNRSIINPLPLSPIKVYSRDNLFFNSIEFSANELETSGPNRIEFHTYHDGKIKINDNLDLSLLHDSTLNENADPILIQRIYYTYHNSANQTFEVANFQALQIYSKGTGSPNSNLFPNFPTGWTQFIDYTDPPVIANVSAKQSYKNVKGDIVTNGSKYGNSNYKIFYRKIDKKTFIVHFEAFNFIPLDIEFSFEDTKRFYCSPQMVAAFIGALVDISNFVDDEPNVPFNIISTGSCFKDGTSFPSLEHNNGYAIDTKYHNGNPLLTIQQELNRDQAFVNAMAKFGCTEILRGANGYSSNIGLPAVNGGSLHDTHLHSGELKIK